MQVGIAGTTDFVDRKSTGYPAIAYPRGTAGRAQSIQQTTPKLD
jgi:hypothetical protein